MATKRTKAQVSSTPSSHPLPSKTSLRRFFTEKQETDMRSKMAAAEKSPASSAPASPAPSESSTEGTDIKSILTQLPSKLDLEAMFSKMERSFGDKLQSLHEEVSHIGNRVQLLEEGGETIALQIHNMQTLQQTQNEALIFLQKKIEDLDNRGRRNNLRIRGIPEAPEGTNENITQTLTNLFNQLLGRPVDTPIKLDRVHRAIRPKVLANETPRDIICRIHHFPIKETILQKAKQIRDITFSDRKVQIFQDLAQSTLIARRALRPITKALSDRNICFRWAYPFALVVNRQGKTHSISTPADVLTFQQALGIPTDVVEDWTGLYMEQDRQLSQKAKWQRSPKKRGRRAPSGNELPTTPKGNATRPT
ncbi:Hypothetical predicted protein [Pelobates cultripes]|uniref:L1 transposable element RRM domain-containing protein n=1 Tax=Pelobates cultripes TaxID=61616 RepID=A0AAD1SAE1_PELCU|nr:Hypothetical predicted protein [Pelobates cultripes]